MELPGPGWAVVAGDQGGAGAAPAGEMTSHLGYERHDQVGRRTGNSRNGTTGTPLLTDVGAGHRSAR